MAKNPDTAFGRLFRAATKLFKAEPTPNRHGFGRGLDPMNVAGKFQYLTLEQVRERNAFALLPVLKKEKYKSEWLALTELMRSVERGEQVPEATLLNALNDVATTATRRGDMLLVDAVMAISGTSEATSDVAGILPYPNDEWGLEPLGCAPVNADGVHGWLPYGVDSVDDRLGMPMLTLQRESDELIHASIVFSKDPLTVLWHKSAHSNSDELPNAVAEAETHLSDMAALNAKHGELSGGNL